MSPNAMTSNTPPSDSFAFRSRSISATICLVASGSRHLTGDSSTFAKSSGVRSFRRGAWTLVIWITCEKTSTPSSREERLRHRPAGDPGRGLASARPLEDVPDVARFVLLRPDQVRVARPRQMDLGDGGLHRPRVHSLLPVRVVAVGHLERDRAAEGPSVPDAARNLDLVALDLHPAAPAVAELASGEIAVQRVAVERQARRQSLEDAGQSRAVGLSGGCQAQRHGRCRLRTDQIRPVPGAAASPACVVVSAGDGAIRNFYG